MTPGAHAQPTPDAHARPRTEPHAHAAQPTPDGLGRQPGTDLQGGDAQGDIGRRVAGPFGALRVDATGDRAVAVVAAAQCGVVSRAQLEAVGLGRGAIASRVASGRLHRLHRGVYAVGHVALAPHAREVAALLACGPTAVLSHGSAAALWGVAPAGPGPIEVTAPGRNCRAHAGIRSHRAIPLADEDVRRRRRLPVTAPARTLLDLAGRLDAAALERAFDEALVQRLANRNEIKALLRRSRHRAGVPALRALLDRLDEPRLTRSEAERRLLALVKSAQLPSPRTNVRVGRYEVDALWSGERLVVEVDGYAFHSSRSAFERDRARDAELQARGLRVLRVTWRQLTDEPGATVGRIARLLGRGER